MKPNENDSQRLQQKVKGKFTSANLVSQVLRHARYKKKGLNFTNQILFVKKQEDGKNQIVYFIPAYCRIKMKNIIELDLEKLTGKINFDIILAVYYGNLSEKNKDFLGDNMVLNFPKNQPVRLSEQNQKTVAKRDWVQQKCFQFTIRKIMDVQILNQIRWAPFQIAKLIISINLKKIKYYTKSGKKIKFKFNFMDIQGQNYEELKFSLGSQKHFGLYTIADKMLKVNYTNEYSMPQQKQKWQQYNQQVQLQHENQEQARLKNGEEISIDDRFQASNFQLKQPSQIIKDTQEEDLLQGQGSFQFERLDSNSHTMKLISSVFQFSTKKASFPKIDCFQYAHFILPLYKQPLSMTFTIFFPLILLGVVNIGIFFQDNINRGKQMLNMLALMISFIALLPNIRQSMGIGVGITLAEVCVFFQAVTIVLTFIHMLQGISIYNFQQILQKDALAIICIIITTVVFSVIVFFSLVHEFYWKNTLYLNKNRCKQNFKFNRRQWANKQCDKQFMHSKDFRSQKIKMILPLVYAESQNNKSNQKVQIKQNYQEQKPILKQALQSNGFTYIQ